MDDLVSRARTRTDTMRSDQASRVKARADRVLMKRRRTESSNGPEADNYEEKTRVLIAAIRSHTNTDIELDTKMSPSQLFSHAIKCLSGQTAEASARESQFVGEALNLISNLNDVLKRR